MNEVSNVGYVQSSTSGMPGSGGPTASSALTGMMNASARYTTPGYQMNAVTGAQQIISASTDVPHMRPVYNVQQQQQQANMMEMQDRMRNYQQQQYQQIYYQQQPGQQVGQQQVHQLTAQQQQQQIMMMNAGVSPGQLTPQQKSPAGSSVSVS